MKQLLVVTNLITIAAVIYLLVTSNKQNAIPLPPVASQIAPDCNLGRKYTGVEVPGLISVEYAKIISENYAMDNGKKFIIKDGVVTSEEDARSVRFGFEKIKKYMWQIEELFLWKKL